MRGWPDPHLRPERGDGHPLVQPVYETVLQEKPPLRHSVPSAGYLNRQSKPFCSEGFLVLQKSPRLCISKPRRFSQKWSECRDLNPGPLGPEPSAIPSFATPRFMTLSYYNIIFRNVKKFYRLVFGFFLLKLHELPRAPQEISPAVFFRALNDLLKENVKHPADIRPGGHTDIHKVTAVYGEVAK